VDEEKEMLKNCNGSKIIKVNKRDIRRR